MIRIVLLAVGGVVVLFVALVVITAILMVTGTPGTCVDRAVPVSDAASQELQAAWDAFEAQALTGPATLSMTEAQVTSRGVRFLEDEDIPISDLQVYFCPDGLAEAAGTLDVASANIVIHGTLDLSGDEPEIDIDSVRVGNLPGFMSDAVADAVLSNEEARILDEIEVNLLTLEITDGSATLTGGP